jgi:hypothetical protein
MISAPPLTPAFHPAAREPIANNVASSRGASVIEKAERISRHAETHFEKHREQWISTRYRQLLLKESAQPSMRPMGASDDRKAHLYRAATFLTERKQTSRIQSIEHAANRMLGLERKSGLEL